jgi:hypothetical protein
LCVCTFSLHRESPDRSWGDEPLFFRGGGFYHRNSTYVPLHKGPEGLGHRQGLWGGRWRWRWGRRNYSGLKKPLRWRSLATREGCRHKVLKGEVHRWQEARGRTLTDGGRNSAPWSMMEGGGVKLEQQKSRQKLREVPAVVYKWVIEEWRARVLASRRWLVVGNASWCWRKMEEERGCCRRTRSFYRWRSEAAGDGALTSATVAGDSLVRWGQRRACQVAWFPCSGIIAKRGSVVFEHSRVGILALSRTVHPGLPTKIIFLIF